MSAAAQAFKKFIRVVADRDGLDALHKVFAEMDTDHSGGLSHEGKRDDTR
jgi:hypothetical protein